MASVSTSGKRHKGVVLDRAETRLMPSEFQGRKKNFHAGTLCCRETNFATSRAATISLYRTPCGSSWRNRLSDAGSIYSPEVRNCP